MNELMIKIRILMKQSLPYVFTLKELNSDLFQQYTFHISTSKPLNNSLCTWLCVCVYVCRLCTHTHACVCMCMCLCPCTYMRWLGYIHGLWCQAQSTLQKHTGMHKRNLLKTSMECPVLHNFLMPNTVSEDGLIQLHIKICTHLSIAGSALALSCCYSCTYKVS